jgi:WD40 repeat protein
MAELAKKTTFQVKVWDLFTGREQVLPPDHGIPQSLAISPDRKRLGVRYSDDTVKVWDLAAAQVSASLDRPVEGLAGVVFSPEGKALAFCDDGGGVRLVDVATGEPFLRVNELPTGNQEAHLRAGPRQNLRIGPSKWPLVFTRDGRRFAYAGREGALMVCDARTGEVLHRLPAHSEYISELVFTPDGQRLISSGGSTNHPEGLRIWDVQSGLELLTLPEPTEDVSQIVISPDGHRLAACTGTEVLIWDCAPLAEGEPR